MSDTPWHQQQSKNFHRSRTHGLVAQLSPADGTYFSTLVIPDRKVRVRVLDARSRGPVANAVLHGAWVLPAGTDPPTPGRESSVAAYAAVRIPFPIDWDIANHPPIGKSTTGFTEANWSGLKRALTLLHYAPGHGTKADKHLKAALAQFRADFGIAEPKTGAKDSETVPRVIKEHDHHAFDMIRRWLTAYGFPCSGKGDWDAEAGEALVQWQALFLRVKDRTKFPTKELCKSLVKHSSQFTTNEAGVVEIPVPLALMEKGCTLAVSFQDFGIIAAADASKWRHDGTPLVEWHDSQDLATGALGWRLRGPGDGAKVEALPEFQWLQSFSIPALPTRSFDDLKPAEAMGAKFNDTYGSKARVDIDVIGLVWCQPAWDAIEDPKTKETNKDVRMPDPARTTAHRHLHVVTAFTGKDPEHYGLLDVVASTANAHYRGRKGAHNGWDVQVKLGEPVFAFHGGKAVPMFSEDGGSMVQVQSTSNKTCVLIYLHLAKSGRATGMVRAGEIIGKLARSGNINRNPFTPSHCHMAHHGDQGFVAGLLAMVDSANRVCLPNNETIPRLFPCRCEMQPVGSNDDWEEDNETDYSDLADCKFSDGSFTDTCWAVKTFRCPEMANGPEIFLRQAQLRAEGHELFVNGKQGGAYKKAIKDFRHANGLPPGDALDAPATAILDARHPIVQPE